MSLHLDGGDGEPDRGPSFSFSPSLSSGWNLGGVTGTHQPVGESSNTSRSVLSPRAWVGTYGDRTYFVRRGGGVMGGSGAGAGATVMLSPEGRSEENDTCRGLWVVIVSSRNLVSIPSPRFVLVLLVML